MGVKDSYEIVDVDGKQKTIRRHPDSDRRKWPNMSIKKVKVAPATEKKQPKSLPGQTFLFDD